MIQLENIKPERVFYYFEQLCKIPRGSGNMEGISSFCMDFAKQHHLEADRDEFYNVLIRKKASTGKEESETLILQAHLDMVCEKDAGHLFDFEKDELELIVSDGKITANHTTLGADNGIGMAYCLAILASHTIVHPPLEVLFTSDEEVGMIGAGVFDASVLKGRRMLNLDCEGEEYLTAGCAGGVRCEGRLPLSFVETQDKGGMNILISGLKGGHSGESINKGGKNATKLLGRLLFEISQKFCFSIVELEGGNKDNVIPRQAAAKIVLENQDVATCQEFVADFYKKLQLELADWEPDLLVETGAHKIENSRMLSPNSKGLVIFLLMNLPNGVQDMSYHIPGMPETSLNLGVAKLEEDELIIQTLIRSSIQTAKEALRDKVAYLIEFLGGECFITQNYPGWSYKEESSFRDICVEAFRRVKKHDPKVQIIHAGLECGILTDKIPGVDCISMGPDLYDIHTTRETADIESVKNIWEIILEILKNA